MISSLKTKDAPPPLSRRLRSKAWHMLMPAFKVKAGAFDISVPAIAKSASQFPEVWPQSWRLVLMKRLIPMKAGAFVDIGANIGQTLIDYLVSGADVGYFGFEPNPECLVLLNQIIERNNLVHFNIVPAGLADREGLLQFFVAANSNADSGGSLVGSLRPAKAVRSFHVPCYRFDHVRESLGIADMSLVKIDVEGGELAALTGMRRSLLSCRPFVAVEVLYRDAHANEAEHNRRNDAILALLEHIEYVLYRIEKTDESAIQALRRLGDFPRAVWTEENRHECDYLLVPRERIVDIEQLRFS